MGPWGYNTFMDHLPSVNLEPEDIQANQRGELSSTQRWRLTQKRLLSLVQTVVFGVVFSSLSLTVYWKLTIPAFASRGELFLVAPIGLLWLWLLRHGPVQFIRIHADLRENKSAQVQGPVLCRWENSIGIIPVPKYKVRAAGEYFSLSSREFFQFRNHAAYQIIYSPRAKIFLGALPVNEQAGTAASPLQMTQVVEIDNLLNPREKEILVALANGLSNKEIAAELFLSVNTIKMYTTQIYRKLGVTRRTEAAAAARKLGLV